MVEIESSSNSTDTCWITTILIQSKDATNQETTSTKPNKALRQTTSQPNLTSKASIIQLKNRVIVQPSKCLCKMMLNSI